MAKSDAWFMTKMTENPLPLIWIGTYLYSSYKGVATPPPLLHRMATKKEKETINSYFSGQKQFKELEGLGGQHLGSA